MKFTDLFVTDWNYVQVKVSRSYLKALVQGEEEINFDPNTGEVIEEQPAQEMQEQNMETETEVEVETPKPTRKGRRPKTE